MNAFRPSAAPATRARDAACPPAACDVLVVGGGINGAGIARDLAGRGLQVVLCEKDDLASHTSSASTKLIHGGLRYLEHYEFGLVRKSLQEREVLLRSAPHIIWPLRFVMPHNPSMRPGWMIRMGLFLYDHLARREVLPGSDGIALRGHPAGGPLKPEFTRGFVYSDGWVDDARLVVLNAVDAAQHGACVLTRTACSGARRVNDAWDCTLRAGNGRTHSVRARLLVNATGPWAARFLEEQVGHAHRRNLRLVKGSHVVVPRMFDHPMAYIFQNPDKRIIFAIPYEHDFTLIGTTDVEHTKGLDAVRIDEDEIRYLCEQASRYFRRPVRPTDVVWSYSGVRPLLDDESGSASEITRDYQLELDEADGATLLSVWGGKITTFRKLAEEAADIVCRTLDHPQTHWTESASLPGGDLTAWIGSPVRPDTDFERFRAEVATRYPWLPDGLTFRLARAYGSRIEHILGEARSVADLGPEVAPGLFETELQYLTAHEWATDAQDILWRRSKLGLHYTQDQRDQVRDWMNTETPAACLAV